MKDSSELLAATPKTFDDLQEWLGDLDDLLRLTWGLKPTEKALLERQMRAVYTALQTAEVRSVLAERPSDNLLAQWLKKEFSYQIPGLTKGATDKQVLALFGTWESWRWTGDIGYRGGNRPQLMMAKVDQDLPILEGPMLIATVRRVLKIPQLGKPKVDQKAAASGKVVHSAKKPHKKATKKPVQKTKPTPALVKPEGSRPNLFKIAAAKAAAEKNEPKGTAGKGLLRPGDWSKARHETAKRLDAAAKELLGDRNVNDYGVFIDGMDTITVPASDDVGTIELEVVHSAIDGMYRSTFYYDLVGAITADNAPLKIDGQAFESRAYAIKTAAERAIAELKLDLGARPTAAAKKVMQQAIKSLETFLANSPEIDGPELPPAGRASVPHLPGLGVEPVGSHGVMA